METSFGESGHHRWLPFKQMVRLFYFKCWEILNVLLGFVFEKLTNHLIQYFVILEENFENHFTLAFIKD